MKTNQKNLDQSSSANHHSVACTLRRRKKRLGATAIEFAMVAPVFVFVIAVCGEFARLSMMRNLAQHAAYESARFVIAEGATIQDGIDRANQILARLGTQGAIVTINGSDGIPDANGNVPNEITFDTQHVSCEIIIPLEDNAAILPANFMGKRIVVSEMSLRTERYRGYYDGVSVD